MFFKLSSIAMPNWFWLIKIGKNSERCYIGVAIVVFLFVIILLIILNLFVICLYLNLQRDDDITRTPQTLRRLLSREDTDVFSRLGAGPQDPTPGGIIRATNEKVFNQCKCPYLQPTSLFTDCFRLNLEFLYFVLMWSKVTTVPCYHCWSVIICCTRVPSVISFLCYSCD